MNPHRALLEFETDSLALQGTTLVVGVDPGCAFTSSEWNTESLPD